jgi:UDP-N-acetylbacillosamine N-acetyltransferase
MRRPIYLLPSHSGHQELPGPLVHRYTKRLQASAPIRLVIWGASGHARVVADAARACGQFEIAGFLDDSNPAGAATPFEGADILGGRNQLQALRKAGVNHLIVAVGDWQVRLQLGRLAQKHGFRLPVLVHPRAVVAPDVVLGPGSFVAPGAVINPGTRVGRQVIVNTAASVDHECRIRDGVHISPGVRVAGCVTIGRGTWVGIGSTVIDRIRIGAGSLIGAGSVVVRHVPDGVVAYGNPARVIRPHPVNLLSK